MLRSFTELDRSRARHATRIAGSSSNGLPIGADATAVSESVARARESLRRITADAARAAKAQAEAESSRIVAAARANIRGPRTLASRAAEAGVEQQRAALIRRS